MVRAWLLLAMVAGAMAACGDNRPLYGAHDLVIVAHEDDDLLFMQPDMFEMVSNHVPTTIVYVTAADAGSGIPFATARATAAKASYGLVAGSQDWHCSTEVLAGHALEYCHLTPYDLGLVFMALPDGGVSGEAPASLLKLWSGLVATADTVADVPATYDRAGLISTVAAIIEMTGPSVIRTLEITSTHGDDHSDHLIVGALALAATAEAGSQASLLSYRGYNINYDPPNNPEPIYDRVSLGMRAYEACLLACGGVCGSVPCPTLSDTRYDGFVHRHYVNGVRRPPMAGFLRAGGGCLTVVDGAFTLGACTAATQVELEKNGNLAIGDLCVHVREDGRLRLGACGGGADRYFLFDDEGHLWAGLPPAPGPGMDTDHSLCLISDGGKVRGALCGSHQDFQWELVRHVASSPRPRVGNASRGRTVRMGDLTGDGKADLCSIGNGRLVCAAGDGTGEFGAPTAIGGDDATLAIEPESLALGDLDGDGRLDACGRSSTGIVCATAASGFVAEAWSPVFARTGGATASDRSLAIVDGTVCGLDGGSVVCVAKDATTPIVHSAWPAADATLWPGDLDGDGAADWCVTTNAGPACSLGADREVTTDGVPWGFAEDQQVEGSLATDGMLPDSAHAALADISGDGRADLCVLVSGNVECAISQGSSFGPRAVVLQLPDGATPDALWLGDIDGDGKADPCVDDGASITCAPSP